MKYIETVDGNLHIRTLAGTRVISNRNFNYKKIKTLLEEGAKSKEILPLLEEPAMPDGMYEVFLLEEENLMYYLHTITTDTGGPVSTVKCLNGATELRDDYASRAKFAGVYVSVEDIIDDWPEYAL